MEVEGGQRAIRLTGLDPLGLLRLQVAEGGQPEFLRGPFEVRLPDVLDVPVQGLVEAIRRLRPDVRQGEGEVLLLVFDGRLPEGLPVLVCLLVLGHEVDHREHLAEAADPLEVALGVHPLSPRHDDLDPAGGQFSGDPEGLPVPEVLSPVVLGVEVGVGDGIGGLLGLSGRGGPRVP